MSIIHPSIDDPTICIVHTRDSQRMSPKLAAMLLPVDPATFHQVRLPAGTPVELHYHNIDEYWWFTSGRPTVTLRSATGVVKKLVLEPGDMVATVRGVEHTLIADHELVYFEFNSDLKACPMGGGHLERKIG